MKISVLTLVILLVMSITLVATAEAIYYPVAIVQVHWGSYLNVRRTPSGELTYYTLARGVDVVIIDQVEGWALIQPISSIDGEFEPIGWVSVDFIIPYRSYIVIQNDAAGEVVE